MIRIDKYLCATVGVTRREAAIILRNKRVTVDGEIIKSGAVKIDEMALVLYDGAPLSLSGPRYFMMNKPLDYVCSQEDPSHPTVFNLFDELGVDKLHIAGRLDVDTTGLLLVTDDGQWSHRVTSPKQRCGKKYSVALALPVTDEVIGLFEEGIQLKSEKDKTLPAKIEILDERHLYLTLYEGKYHQVKRMFASIGNKVVELHRDAIGTLLLDPRLAPGEYRPLRESEIALFNAKK